MRQALELALEALNTTESDCGSRAWEREQEAIDAIKEALAQPEQEPVAYLSNKRQRINIELKPQAFVKIPTVTDWEMPLYMKPPQRTWVGLTDEQMQFLATAIGQAKQIIDTYNTEFVTARDDLRRCSELLAAHNIKE